MRKIIRDARKKGVISYLKENLFTNKGTKQTIIKNTFWLLFSEGINKGLLFLLTILIARYLGAEGYGQFSFAFAFVAIFSVIADFGLSALMIREVARNKKIASKYVSNISFLKIWLGIITFILIVVVAQFLGKTPDLMIVIYLAAVYTIINTFNDFFRSVFRAFEQMQHEAYSKIINGVFLFIIVAIFIYLELPMIYIVLGYIAASIIQLLYTLVQIKNDFIKINISYDKSAIRSILKDAWPFAISGIFVSAYMWTDTVMLSLMKTDEVVGWYSAAYKLVFNLAILPFFFMSAIYPKISRASVNSKKRFKEAYKTSFKIIGITAIIIFPILFFVAKPLLLFLYGDSFLGAVIAFQILLWAEFFAYFSHVFLFTLNAMNKQIKYTLVVGMSLIANVILNFILIPKYSYIGAGIATVVTEGIGCLLLWYYTSKELK